MWNRRSAKDPSEVNTPNVWIRIREQNHIKELNRNESQEPHVYKTPDKWIFLGVVALYSGVTVGGVVNGLFNLVLALA